MKISRGVLSTLHSSQNQTLRGLSVLSSNNVVPNSSLKTRSKFEPNTQQSRTFLGLVNAIDKQIYRWAKNQLPPISKTEQIALGCGTIGKFTMLFTNYS